MFALVHFSSLQAMAAAFLTYAARRVRSGSVYHLY